MEEEEEEEKEEEEEEEEEEERRRKEVRGFRRGSMRSCEPKEWYENNHIHL